MNCRVQKKSKPGLYRALLTVRILTDMAQKGKALQAVPVWGTPTGAKKQLGGLLGGAQELTPSFVCVCLPGGKSDAGHFPPGENTTIRGSTEPGGNVPWGRGGVEKLFCTRSKG